MNYSNLLEIASFTPRSIQYPGSWLGHLPFAAWVIKEFQPKIFVELGTHSGNSYFSFCQAVKEFDLLTKCFAVDTWQGDEHAGQYDDAIYAKVSEYNQEHYADFSRLLRMTFDDAAPSFTDQSIELLHIDGLHTYEAVRHDFETWLPKLAPGALVVLHDTNVHELGFGVWKLWAELEQKFPSHTEFFHSHGLGVLQLNDAPEAKKIGWLQPNSPEKERLVNYFAALGARQMDRFALKEAEDSGTIFKQKVLDLEQAVAELSQEVIAKEMLVTNLQKSLTEREKELGENIFLKIVAID